jgi:hypothetical protein
MTLIIAPGLSPTGLVEGQYTRCWIMRIICKDEDLEWLREQPYVPSGIAKVFGAQEREVECDDYVVEIL